MEVKNRIKYNLGSSLDRIEEILSSSDNDYSTLDYIPARGSFTYTNGAYTRAIALFIDIIGSSKLTSSHTKPVVAKIYRSFISECTAILNSEEICEEININGDCVWGAFKADCVDDYGIVFHVAASLNSLLGWMNWELNRYGYRQIEAGIGVADGSVLIVKAGYPGSAINDLIWMGDAINQACHLANIAGRNGLEPILMTKSIVSRVNKHRQSLVYPINNSNVYGGNFVATEME